MRRVITGDDGQGNSTIIIDGPPADTAITQGRGGLLEIWTDTLLAAIEPQDPTDRGKGKVVLSPPKQGVKVRWFVIEPVPEGIAKADLDAAARAAFAAFGAEHHVQDQSRHSAMHETHTLDVICLLQGEVSLILESGETRLKPGQVVIQRATNHAWVAHGGPALLLAILIDRPVVTQSL
ncbi:MAG: cupin domain-containing protein [Alphaproteobacteria bacterium]|nr:cupin domain-containing protein [Alphaproteobacteria bacterium]MBV9693309.1 cupin domain-containing protein [Alphaproteobacteria bacterium]